MLDNPLRTLVCSIMLLLLPLVLYLYYVAGWKHSGGQLLIPAYGLLVLVVDYVFNRGRSDTDNHSDG
jgi:hypothetical protein